MSEPRSASARSASARGTFVWVLLPGVAAAVLAAVAASRPWAVPGASTSTGYDALAVRTAGEVPLASALSLVMLAGWGAVLVTRGRARRVFALLGLLAGLGLLIAVVHGGLGAPDAVRHAVDGQFALPRGSSADLPVRRTGWFWVMPPAALVATAAFLLAVRFAPSWPAMGGRYDAPGAARAARGHAADPVTGEDSGPNSRDLWRALDDGEDPTIDDR